MQLHPRHFGRDLRDKLVSKLMKDVEGTCSGRHGFIVAITGIESVGKGLIRDGTGFVTFPVKYQCVVFRPFKGEILEAVVTMVNKMGFFAEAGPVQIFVSNHLIPDDMEFQSGDAPNYTTSDGSVKIQKDSEVRLKIIGTRVDATEIFCIVIPEQLSDKHNFRFLAIVGDAVLIFLYEDKWTVYRRPLGARAEAFFFGLEVVLYAAMQVVVMLLS
nr:DNA-directed RNA polymerase II subunit RPB7 [Ipomoea batatas]